MIERVVGNRPLFVEETIQTEQLVVEAFIVNQDAAYSNIIFHLDNDSYDFYYRDLFPVNDAQFAELLRLKEQGQAISEEIVMGVVNDTRWWPPWFKARYYMPSVQGVGYLGCPDADITSPSYIRWSNMVARCYSENRQKRFPGYKGVQVADEWKNYATYRKWHDSHFYQVEGEKMDVDHDISIPGSKLYGPCTAAFVPHSVNMVVCYLKSNHPEGMPIGVYQDKKGLFYVVASFLGERWTSENHYKYLGEATNAYKRIKEKAIALKAEQYKNFLPRTVYDSLICWVVDTKYIKKKISAG